MRYKIVLQCAACGAVISETDKMTAKEVMQNHVVLGLTSVFAGSCPEGCRPILSGCNVRTKIRYQNENGKRVAFGVIRREAEQEARGGS